MVLRKLFLLMAIAVSITVSAQQKLTASGIVTDAHGEGVIGATVKVKGSNTGAVTDFDGKFSIPNLKAGDKLEITYVGMKPQTVSVKQNMKIVLEDDNSTLDEVVVTAFGQQKRSAFTGSATVMDSKAIEKKQLTNVISALQGEAAGVQMVNNSGDPTSSPTLRIRGFSSISAGNDPLIIVDGAPYDGGWKNINPADVASITVLKDAASAALYGSRGSNGVIQITTKKAQTGEATVTLDAKWGATSRIKRDYETIDNIGEYYETYYDALYNYAVRSQGMNNYAAHEYANSTLSKPSNQGGLGYMVMSVPYGEYLIGDNGKLNPHATLGNRVINSETGEVYTLYPDDWMKEASRTGSRQEYNMNINGGNDKLQYYASLGYLKTEGICSNSDFERYSTRLKADYQAKEWLRTGANIAFTRSKCSYASTSSNNLFYFAQSIAPIYPVYLRDGSGNIMTDSNGKMYDYGDGAENGLDRPYQPKYNPLQDADLNGYGSTNNQFSLNGYVDVSPLEGLKVTLKGTVTADALRYFSTSNPYYGYSASLYPDGYVYQGTDDSYSYNFQELVSYRKSFGKHNLDLLVGHENYSYEYNYLYGTRTGMASYFDNQTLAGAITINTNGSSRTNYNTEGYLFRAMYDYDSKYYGEFSLRRDASSRFHPDHRWGTFYSLGGSWVMKQEEWLKDVSWLNSLKLKASYGEVGNDNIGDYRYMNTYDVVNSDGNIGFVLASIGNENITWETKGSLNAGIEFEILNSRIRGDIEYFYAKTTDMLCFVSAPKSLGYGGSYDNIGDMVNKGVEMELSGDVIKTKDFTWTLSANGTFQKNKITKIADKLRTKTVGGYQGYSSGSYYYGEGLPLYTWYMPKYAGVATDGASQWYITSSSGEITTTKNYADATYYICGDPNPDVYGGFTTSFASHGFDLSVHFTYSIGGKSLDNGYAALMTNPVQSTTGYAIHKDMLDAWSETNTTSNIPRWQYGDQNTSAFSDRFLTDASSLTLSNINFGYTFPKKVISHLCLSNLRVYISGENLYYWTKRKGFDPRGTFNGDTSTSSYSPSRTISGGLTLSF